MDYGDVAAGAAAGEGAARRYDGQRGAQGGGGAGSDDVAHRGGDLRAATWAWASERARRRARRRGGVSLHGLRIALGPISRGAAVDLFYFFFFLDLRDGYT